MRTSCIALIFAATLGIVSCNRDNQTGPTARQAGRDAYRASQAAKRDAHQAERELKNASKDFREGWEQAKHGDTTHR